MAALALSLGLSLWRSFTNTEHCPTQALRGDHIRLYHGSSQSLLRPLQRVQLRLCLRYLRLSLPPFLPPFPQIALWLTILSHTGEGATTSPGRFTPLFGHVKGRAEAALLALSKESAYSSLRVYSPRPGIVDPKFHAEIHPWVPTLPFLQRAGTALGVVAAVRGIAPKYIAPTRELGDVLVRLAAGDGKPLTGKGVEGEGRTVANVKMREMAGI